MNIYYKSLIEGSTMKWGNNCSHFLDNFTENYAKIAKIVMEHDDIDIPESDITIAGYSDFLDKFAKSQSKDVIKSQVFRFVTTEANRDNYSCEVILRKIADSYKLKLTHYSGSFDYAALQSIWKFAKTEEKLAKQVFETLVYALNGIQKQHNANMKHPTTIAPIIREAIRPIAETHRYKKQILALDEGDLQHSEKNWQQTIYGSKYPELQEESKQDKFSGRHNEEVVKRTMYTGRNTKIVTTNEIKK